MRNDTLTQVREAAVERESSMASDPVAIVRAQIATRVSEIRSSGSRISPLDLHARLDAIRQLAVDHGLGALESLARTSARIALLPGNRIAMQSCLAHVEDALDSHSPGDGNAILAALAVRLH
jgi:hypothetical protein